MENYILREIVKMAVKAKELGHDVFVRYNGHVDNITVSGYIDGYDKGVKISFDGDDMYFVDVTDRRNMSRLATTLTKIAYLSNYNDKTLEVGNLVADIYELARKLSTNQYHTFVYFIPHVNQLEINVYFGKWYRHQKVDLTLRCRYYDVDWLKSVKAKLAEILKELE